MLRALATLLLSCAPAISQDRAEKLDLHVLYVGEAIGARAKAFAEFLADRVRTVTMAPLDGSATTKAKAADVVVLDWPQKGSDIFNENTKPLGARADWNKPTVLIGSSGLMLSSGWRVRGGFG